MQEQIQIDKYWKKNLSQAPLKSFLVVKVLTKCLMEQFKQLVVL